MMQDAASPSPTQAQNRVPENQVQSVEPTVQSGYEAPLSRHEHPSWRRWLWGAAVASALVVVLVALLSGWFGRCSAGGNHSGGGGNRPPDASKNTPTEPIRHAHDAPITEFTLVLFAEDPEARGTFKANQCTVVVYPAKSSQSIHGANADDFNSKLAAALKAASAQTHLGPIFLEDTRDANGTRLWNEAAQRRLLDQLVALANIPDHRFEWRSPESLAELRK